MGFLSSVVGGFFGGGAGDAARAQGRNVQQGIDYNKQISEQARTDFAPYRDAGERSLTRLERLISDPQAQLDFVQNNPFFDALAERAQTSILNNQAARGKLGSGETAEALQNSLLLLGNDLLNQNIAQTSGLANTGFNAVTGTTNAALGTAGNITNLYTDKANADAGAIVGDQRGVNNLVNSAINAVGFLPKGFSLCDANEKDLIKQVGATNKGFPLYLFRYKQSPELHINVIAQDVQKSMPEAVQEIDGKLYVDMGVLYAN